MKSVFRPRDSGPQANSQALEHCQAILKGVESKQESGKRKSKSPVVSELNEIIVKLSEGLTTAKSQIEKNVESGQSRDWAALVDGLIEVRGELRPRTGLRLMGQDRDFLDRQNQAIAEAQRAVLRQLR